MKKHVLAWVIGGAIFVMILDIWVWQLPNAIQRIGGLNDPGFSAIMSMFNTTKGSLSPDLVKARTQFDSNMKKMSQTINIINAQAVQAAVITDLKNKISVKDAIKAATLENANAPVLPVAASKIQTKK
jgi:hypothetical protein